MGIPQPVAFGGTSENPEEPYRSFSNYDKQGILDLPYL
jgi:hypothetical protein